MLTIRRAEPTDAASISEIVCSLAGSLLVDPRGAEASNFYSIMQPERVSANLTKHDRFYLVAEVNGLVVGMILVLNNNYIGQFFVCPSHQRRGVGSALWAAALSCATDAGGTGAFTVKSSLQALPIYQRFGFETTSAESVDAGFRFVPMQRRVPSSAA